LNKSSSSSVQSRKRKGQKKDRGGGEPPITKGEKIAGEKKSLIILLVILKKPPQKDEQMGAGLYSLSVKFCHKKLEVLSPAQSVLRRAVGPDAGTGAGTDKEGTGEKGTIFETAAVIPGLTKAQKKGGREGRNWRDWTVRDFAFRLPGATGL